MPKRVFLYMYLNINFGDDLFLHILLTRYPKTVFFMPYDERYRVFVDKYDNLLFVKEGVFSRIKKRLNLLYNKYIIRGFNGVLVNPGDYDGILFLGGSIFGAGGMIENAEPIFHTYKYLCEVFSARKKMCFFLGCNFERNYPESLINKYEDLFSNAYVDVCFRDVYSQKIFSKLPKIRLAEDIVLGYRWKRKNISDKILGVSIIEIKNRKNLSQLYNEYMSYTAKIVQNAVEDGYKVRLFSFCAAEGDFDAAKALVDLCDCSGIEIIGYEGDLEQFLTKYLESNVIIGTRFHAVILAFKHGIPCLPIVYNGKIANLLDDINWTGPRFDLCGFNRELSVINWNEIKNISSNSYTVRGTWENHFVKFDEFVGKCDDKRNNTSL